MVPVPGVMSVATELPKVRPLRSPRGPKVVQVVRVEKMPALGAGGFAIYLR
jgi:hypothetical protein